MAEISNTRIYNVYKEEERKIARTIFKEPSNEILKYTELRDLARVFGFKLGYQKNFLIDENVEVESIWYNPDTAVILYAESSGKEVGRADFYGQVELYSSKERRVLGKEEGVLLYGLDNGIDNFVINARNSNGFLKMGAITRLYSTPENWSRNDMWKDDFYGFSPLNYTEENRYGDPETAWDIVEYKIYSNPEILKITGLEE